MSFINCIFKRYISTSSPLSGKRNFRKFPLYNKRGTRKFKEAQRKNPDPDVPIHSKTFNFSFYMYVY